MKKLILIAAASLLLSSPALAVDYGRVIMDENGKPMCMEKPEGDKCTDVATVGRLIRNALYTRFPDEQTVDAEVLWKRGLVAQQILDKGNDFKASVTDLDTMKKVIGKKFAPLIIFQVWNEIDPPKKD